MTRKISIGAQGFADIRERGAFIVDKTSFIVDWWHAHDDVTLICRPRRFGKTLNLDMVDCFFSTRYAGRDDLFEDLAVWDNPDLQAEQGKWPVISISFANVKGESFDSLQTRLCSRIAQLYRALRGEIDLQSVGEREYEIFTGKSLAVTPQEAPDSLARLCELLYLQTGKRTIVLIDEYDTPLQEAWVDDCWDQMLSLVRPLFNATLKSNPYLERAIITGITRVARESIFSDLNNLEVITSTSNKYETAFGFTQLEVDKALAEFGYSDPQDRNEVKDWYDGFKFGETSDIYNPWSITNYLDKHKLAPYWASTSSNGLVSNLISKADPQLKSSFETLLEGSTITESIDEQISFPDLDYDSHAIWSLLVASGYLKILSSDSSMENGCELTITNHETMLAFDGMVRRWFVRSRVAYNGFIVALLKSDLESMNAYMNDVALDTFSVFDFENQPSRTAPERFYHGFVLGLLVDLRGRYRVRSNRESGYGRYDVMLIPSDTMNDPGIIMEFKVHNPSHESTLEDTAQAALAQIENRAYAKELISSGVPQSHIHSYGFAFEGKRVLIGAAS